MNTMTSGAFVPRWRVLRRSRTCATRKKNSRVVTRSSLRSPDTVGRVLGALPYLLPLLDGLRYSRYFMRAAPAAGVLLQPILPIAQIYFSVPFAGILSFFGIYLGIVNNASLPRFVRLHAMQAVLVDILLM